MKLLIVSDNHGEEDILYDLVYAFKDQVDAFIHCGDSNLTPDNPIWQEMETVAGNTDYYPDFPNELLLEYDQTRVYVSHGHREGVNYGFQELALKAKNLGAQIACFGHIHRPVSEKIEGVWCVNPGSISQPRGEIQERLFLILDLEDDQISFTYYDRQFKPVKALSHTEDF